MAKSKQSGRKAGKCPVCGKPTVQAHRPFCSAHCGYVDLNRWLGGHYAIPAVEEDRPEETDGDVNER